MTDLEHHLSRRRFVGAAGAAAGVAVALSAIELTGCSSDASPTADAGPGPLDGLLDARAPMLSIGYLAGSAGHRSLASYLEAERAKSVPATQLRTGSLRLSGRSLDVATAGLTPGASDALADRGDAVLLDVLLPTSDLDAPVPFFAWSFRPGPAAVTAAPTAFTVPAGRTHRFGVRVEVRPSEPGRADRTTAATEAAVVGSATQVLTSGLGSDLAKLRSGLYLIGLDHDGWDRPRSLPDDDGGWAELPSLILSVAAAGA